MDIVKYPDPRLRLKASPIAAIDTEIRQLAAAMIEAMHDDRGVGLAGPQVGISRRIITLNVSGREDGDRVLLNPEIVERQGRATEDEGCLSVPGIWAPVERFERVRVRALDLAGRCQTIDAEGLLARAFQHEIDHLDGILFIDRLAPEARMKIADDIEVLESAYSPTA